MPEVENFCGGVRVTIQRTKFMQMMNVTSDVSSDVSSDVVSSVGSLSVVQLSDRQKKIRELILKDTFISTQQMSVVLSVVKRTVERVLAVSPCHRVCVSFVFLLPPDVMADVRFDLQNLKNSRRILYFCR